MTTKLARVREVAQAIQHDAEADSRQVDGTPFTPRGVGETFGAMLAMIAATASLVEVLANECEALQRVLDSRTERLI